MGKRWVSRSCVVFAEDDVCCAEVSWGFVLDFMDGLAGVGVGRLGGDVGLCVSARAALVEDRVCRDILATDDINGVKQGD